MIELFVRSARSHRARYVLTVLSIVFATAFMIVSFEMGRYGRDAITSSSGSDYGHATAMVTPAAPDPNRDLTTEISRIASVGEAYGQSSHTARIRYGSKSVDFRAFNIPDPGFGFFNLLDGSMPLQSNEIAVTQTLASSLGLEVGDTVTVSVKYRSGNQPEEQSFSVPPLVVSGIYENLGPALATGTSVTGYITDATSRQWLTREGKDPDEAIDKVYVTTATGFSDAQMLADVSALDDVVVQSRSSMAQDRAAHLLDSATIMETTTLLLGLFVAALACVVIWNTFQVLALTRRRALATLRCLGASARQVWGMIVGEAFVLGTVSSALGAGIGMALAKFIPTIVRDSDEAWEIPSSIALHPPFALAALATGILVTLACAIAPGYHATRTAPLAALRTGKILENPRTGRWRLLPGVLMLGVGVGAIVFGRRIASLDFGIEPGIWSIGIGGLVLVGSAVALGPILPSAIAIPAARAVRFLFPRGKRINAEFALENIGQFPGRSGTTISALFITTCLLTGTAATAASARETLLTNLDAGYSHDINIHQALDADGIGLGFTPRQQAAVASSPGIAGALAIYETNVKTSVSGYESTTVEAFDPVAARKVVSERSGPRQLRAGRLLLPDSETSRVESASVVGNNGRSITLRVHYVKVTKPTMALPDLKRISSLGSPTTLWASVKDSSRPNARLVTDMATNVNAVSGNHPPVVSSWMLRQHRAYETAIVRITRILVINFVVVTLVAAAGVTSSMTLALVERRRETLVLRSLGQTRRSLRHTLTIEQLVLGSVGMALGCAFGIGGSMLMTKALFAGVETGACIDIPWLSILAVIGLELAAITILTVMSARTSFDHRSRCLRDSNFLGL